MPVQQLKEFLDQANVEYMCLSHPPAFTAQELAHHVKIAGDRVVKTVIIELDGKMAMLVMPATWRIRWDRLSGILAYKAAAVVEDLVLYGFDAPAPVPLGAAPGARADGHAPRLLRRPVAQVVVGHPPLVVVPHAEAALVEADANLSSKR